MAAIAGETFTGDAGPTPSRSGTWTWSGRRARLSWTGSDTVRPDHTLTAAESPLRIVADVRLDDRAALAAAIGIDPHRRSDADLIVLAYRKWGPRCLDRLLGDFAFAIWDEGRAELFCARDHMGVAPLYYRESSGGFAFASRLADLTTPADRPDTGQVLLFTAGVDDDAAATSFDGVRRLPPAHWLLWTPGRLTLMQYWRCEPQAISATDDVVEGFRDRLIQAVDDRLRGPRPIGAMLSGGLDSSSIVSIAASSLGHRQGELGTFSFAYPPGSSFDERPYVDAVLDHYAPAPHFIDMTGVRPLTGITDLVDGRDDLFFAPGAAKLLLLLRSAAADGIATVLDGHGGDEVASHGYGRLAQLARDGRWLQLARELSGVSQTFGASPVSLFIGYLRDYGPGQKLWRRLARMRPPRTGDGSSSPLALVDPDLASAIDLEGRLSAWRQSYRAATHDEQTLHTWSVTWPGVARGFETLRRVADESGVTLRFPFYDQRLVTYALAIPDSEKLRDGWSRSVLRRAMTGILPEAVRQRRTKIDFRVELAAGLVREGRDHLASLIGGGARVGEYVDLAVTQDLTTRLFASPDTMDGADLFAMWRVFLLAQWLDKRAALVTAARPLA